MFTSLYQKYRPQLFSELVGQDHIRTTLLSELQSQTVAHAYLLSGPRGIGKTTTARLIARAVNCTQPRQGEPCNECPNCVMIRENKALDIMEMDAASHTGVDHVRENIIENARVASSHLPWKVFIIDEVHMLSTSAFNALLKTLEEPPAKTMFIFATTEIHKVPATIISRCERFQFRKVSLKDIIKRLEQLATAEKIKVDRAVIEAIAKRSEGALRDAESLLGQVLSLDDKHITVAIAAIVLPQHNIAEMMGLWAEIVHGQLAPAIERVNRLLDEGVLLNEFTKDFIEFLRKILLYKVQDSMAPLQYLDIDEEQLGKIAVLTKKLTPHDLARQIMAFIAAAEQLKTAAIQQLPLELAIIELITAASKSQPGTIGGGDRKDDHNDPLSSPFGTGGTNGAVGSKPDSVSGSGSGVAAVNTGHKTSQKQTMFNKSDTVEVGTKGEGEQAQGIISIETVKQQWTQVLAEMKRHNHALHLTLQVGHIISFEAATKAATNTLTLGYQYKFYQERLADKRNMPVIEQVLLAIFKQPIIIATVVGPEYTPHQPKDYLKNIEEPSGEEVENVWELAAAAFGSNTSDYKN